MTQDSATRNGDFINPMEEARKASIDIRKNKYSLADYCRDHDDEIRELAEWRPLLPELGLLPLAKE